MLVGGPVRNRTTTVLFIYFELSFTFIFSAFNFSLNVCDLMCFVTFMLIKMLAKCGVYIYSFHNFFVSFRFSTLTSAYLILVSC